MCGKLGKDEFESMENMMSLAVYALLADVFDVDINTLSPDSDLKNDLGLTEGIQQRLDTSVREMFNDVQLDFKQVKTVHDIVDQVIKTQFTSKQAG